MRKLILLTAAFMASSFTSVAQDKKQPSISVIGTAEMEIVPDEIYVSVTLKEYTGKDKKKYTIEDLEKSLVNFLEKVTATEKKDIRMDNMSAYVLAMKRKKKDEVISKSYDVKFKNSQQVYELYSVMDSLGISRAYVSKYSHSKMDEYKKQVKIDAIKAARAKADYLMAAIGQSAGKAISVVETTGFVSVDDGTRNDYNYRNSYSNYNVSQTASFSGESGSDMESAIGGKTIKLNYSINAEFAIQ